MIGAGDLKKGMVIDLNDRLYQVVDFQHVKMKHSAVMKVKLKDLKMGHITEQTFQNTEKFVRARLEYRPMQYLYKDSDLYYFMDQENYEQITLNEEQLGEAAGYVKDGMGLEVFSCKGEVLGVKPPDSVELEVTETGPAYKGDTAAGGGKPATLETGIIIQVPIFINIGDVIRVDTRSGLYVERA